GGGGETGPGRGPAALSRAQAEESEAAEGPGNHAGVPTGFIPGGGSRRRGNQWKRASTRRLLERQTHAPAGKEGARRGTRVPTRDIRRPPRRGMTTEAGDGG